jgi:para-nitrobenzyl esterase
MRLLILATAALAIATPALAQTAATAPSASAAKAKYSTTETDLGTLLDNPATKAIVEKHIPGMTSNDQVDMARGMTLKAIQQYASEEVTDARLAAIDADLAKLP